MTGPLRGTGDEMTAVSFWRRKRRSRCSRPTPGPVRFCGRGSPRGTSLGPAEGSMQSPRDLRMVSSQRGMRVGGGDKEDAVEAVACGGLAREGEVAIVDGIERAAKDRQFQGVHRGE